MLECSASDTGLGFAPAEQGGGWGGLGKTFSVKILYFGVEVGFIQVMNIIAVWKYFCLPSSLWKSI